MVGTLVKLVAYGMAPKTTFAVTHPKTAVRLAKMRWDFKHAYAPRIAAVGGAALGLYLGMRLGKRSGHTEIHV